MRFKFKLALALGRTVAELDATMSSSELLSWMVYEKLCPFGYERDNLHTGIIAATIHNQYARKAVSPSEFMIKLPDEKPKNKMQGFLNFLSAVAVPLSK